MSRMSPSHEGVVRNHHLGVKLPKIAAAVSGDILSLFGLFAYLAPRKAYTLKERF